MKAYKMYSIRRRLMLLCIIPMMAIISIMLAFSAYYTATNEHRAWETFVSMADSSQMRVDGQMAQASGLVSTVGYSKNIQDYLINLSQTQKHSRYELIQQNLELLADTVLCVDNLYVRSVQWSIAHARGGLESFAKVLIEYNLWENQTMNGVIYTRPYQDKSTERNWHYMFVLANAQPLAMITTTARTSMPLLVGVQIDLQHLFETPRDKGVIQLILYDGEVILAGDNATDEQLSLALQMGDQSLLPPETNPRYFVSAAQVGSSGYCLVTIMEKTALMGSMEDFWIMCAWAIGIIGALIVLLLMFIMRGIMQPTMQLARDMQAVINGAERVRPSRAEEMSVLSDGVNYMLANLQLAKQQEFEMRENVYQLQLQQSRAEMLAYRSQINPHFFFNTLECLCSMARYFKVRPLEELTEAMSKNFAYSLRETLFVPLEKEIQHVQNYMHIMDIRCPDKYLLRISCAPETLNVQVLSLLLQPLVENSISHGFRNYDKNAPCTIDLRTDIIDRNGPRLRIRFTDNGCGVSPEDLEELNALMKSDEPIGNSHIGLSNIRKRLKLAYGTSSHLRLRSVEGCYLQSELIIPLTALEGARERMGMMSAVDRHKEDPL